MKIERLKMDGFVIDIIEDEETYETWLSVEYYGVKTFMFGVMKNDTSKESFRKMAIDNISEYGERYLAEYGD